MSGQHLHAAWSATCFICFLDVVETDFATNLAKEETEEAEAQYSYEAVPQENRITKNACWVSVPKLKTLRDMRIRNAAMWRSTSELQQDLGKGSISVRYSTCFAPANDRQQLQGCVSCGSGCAYPGARPCDILTVMELNDQPYECVDFRDSRVQSNVDYNSRSPTDACCSAPLAPLLLCSSLLFFSLLFLFSLSLFLLCGLGEPQPSTARKQKRGLIP